MFDLGHEFLISTKKVKTLFPELLINAVVSDEYTTKSVAVPKLGNL